MYKDYIDGKFTNDQLYYDFIYVQDDPRFKSKFKSQRRDASLSHEFFMVKGVSKTDLDNVIEFLNSIISERFIIKKLGNDTFSFQTSKVHEEKLKHICYDNFDRLSTIKCKLVQFYPYV